MFLLNKNLLTNLGLLILCFRSGSGKTFLLFVLIQLTYIVGVGLLRLFTIIKYIASLIRLARGAFSVPLLKSMSEAFSVPFYTLIKHKSSWVIKFGPSSRCGILFSSVQSLSRVRLFATPRIAARQASPSITNSRSLPKPMSIESVMPSNQPSHSLLSPSPPALNLSQHQGLFKWVSPSHQVAKILEFQLQHQSFQRTPKTDLL